MRNGFFAENHNRERFIRKNNLRRDFHCFTQSIFFTFSIKSRRKRIQNHLKHPQLRILQLQKMGVVQNWHSFTA